MLEAPIALDHDAFAGEEAARSAKLPRSVPSIEKK
jgi:hypothetical protein